MMQGNEEIAIESCIQRQRAEVHGAQSHARSWGHSVPHGLSIR
jgi:hypothetical protein